MKNSGKILFAATAVFMAMTVFEMDAYAGSLEPTAPPAPTMKSLDDVRPSWSQILPANDGDPVTGCNSSRFKCVMNDEAVLDRETGLVWEKMATSAVSSWPSAMNTCDTKTVAGRKGWRLPAVEELASLLDMLTTTPLKLPQGHPFGSVQPSIYWSGTTHAVDTNLAWTVNFNYGGVGGSYKTSSNYVRCVRGGQGYDGQ